MNPDFMFYAMLLVGTLSTLMGSIVIIEATIIYRQAVSSKGWPSTSGKIIEAKVVEKEGRRTSREKIYESQTEDRSLSDAKEYKESQLNIRTVNKSFRSKEIIYDSHIEYQYLVGGKEYKGDQLSIGNLNKLSRSREIAEQQVNKFTEGQEVIVYYNSSKPKISSMSVGVDRALIRQFVFGSIFLFLGITIIGLMVSIRNL